MVRIVRIYALQYWVGTEDTFGYIEIPDGLVLDLQVEEEQWFAAGGDSHMPFIDYLVTKGAKKVEGEEHCIGYM
jgi:hypothetical protein